MNAYEEPPFTDEEYQSEDQPPVDTWQIRTLANAYQDRPPTQYIVDKYFARGTLSIVYGAPAVMKSMLMADLCACVVAGQDWLPGSNGNGHGIPVTQSPIFWLDMDNGTRRTDERFDALAKARKLSITAPLYYLSMPNPPFALDDLDGLLRLIDVIRACQAKFVVIDNLGLSTGNVEENSAAMAHVMGYLRILTERTDAAVIVIHHQRKGGAGQGRAGDALRGHSSIEASLDLALHVIREPNSAEIIIRSTKTRGVDVPQVTGRFNFEHVPGTSDLATAWFDGIAPVRGDNPVREAIIKILEDTKTGMTKGRLIDLAHDKLRGEVGVLKIRNWITEMIAQGEIVEAPGQKHNAKIIKLP